MKSYDDPIAADICELACIMPEIGAALLDGAVINALSPARQCEFDDHLPLCEACREDLEYGRWLYQRLRLPDAWQSERDPGNSSLQVVSIFDGLGGNVSEDYHASAFTERLAASSETSDQQAYPYVITYQDGIVGEFHQRGASLFYDLKHSTIEGKTYACALCYSSPSDPEDVRIFQLREGQSKRLGALREFVPFGTLRELYHALKCFTLIIRR